MTARATSEASVVVPGTVNFRDVGGLALVGGGETATRRLFRSDGLHALPPSGLTALHDLGVATVIDLRSVAEVELMPDRLGDLACESHHVEILSGSWQSLAAAPSLVDLYAGMVLQGGAALAAAQRLIAEAPAGAVVVHCTAGKDRTGVVVALALLAAGVEPEAVVRDYSATEARLRGEWATAMVARAEAAGLEVTTELRVLLSASPPSAMRQTLALIDDHFGSVGAYLLSQGLDVDAQARLRERLV